ncbi:MAG: L-rhamnose mutarotase [Halobacteriales archaeon]
MSDSDDVDRVVLVQELKPDRVGEYLEAHEDVPDPVTERMAESGVEEFRLFVGDDLSIGYIEVEDFERFQAEYSADPDCEDWEERVAEFKQSGVDTEEGDFPVLDEVWTFEAGDGA